MATTTEHDKTVKELDDMSRDLMLLTKTVAIYPEGHPQVAQMARRLAAWAMKAKGRDGITIGVTGSELIIDGQFYGGADTRIETLARRLHAKRIAKVHWKDGIKESEVYGFAKVLADQKINGDEIVTALTELGIANVGVTGLDLGALHERMRLMDNDFSSADRERSKKIWQWLQEVAGTPTDLAKAMVDREFWDDAFSGDAPTQAEFIELLSAVGAMVDKAIATMNGEMKRDILDKFDKLGQTLSPENLARLADVYMTEGAVNGMAMSALMAHIKGEKLAGLLGGLVALGGPREERLALFIQKFLPADSILGLAGLVGDWKGSAQKLGFSSEVWQWLESYLLNIDENQFMGDGYRATLDRMAEKMNIFGSRSAAFGFYEDPETHLDNVCAGLGLLEGETGVKVLSERITERLNTLDGVGVVSFLKMVDHTAPSIFNSRVDIYEKLFTEIAPTVKDLPQQAREELMRFTRRHEDTALEVVLKQLSMEDRLSVRRFLVEILASMSRNVVPRIIQSTRNAPWYYTRNIAVVFGHMKDTRTVPFLKLLLESQQPKLRREAIRSLSMIGDSSSKIALSTFANRSDIPSDETRMAAFAADRIREVQ